MKNVLGRGYRGGRDDPYRIGHVKSEGQVLLHSLGLDLGFNTLPCFFVQVLGNQANISHNVDITMIKHQKKNINISLYSFNSAIVFFFLHEIELNRFICIVNVFLCVLYDWRRMRMCRTVVRSYRSEASNVVLQPFVGGPQLADFVLQPSDPAPQGGDFPLVLPDLVVQAVQFIPKFSTLFITGKTSERLCNK